MPDKPADEGNEPIAFWGGWKGLYLFIIVYAIAQIVFLYFFTTTLNRS